MTESEWQECIDPGQMLAYLGDRAGARKKRLFACACIRRVWPLLTEKRLRRAVRLAECFANGQASEQHLEQALPLVDQLCEEFLAAAKRRASWKARALHAAALAVQGVLVVKEPRLERPRDVREPPDVVTATRIARTAARAAEARREERRGMASSAPADSPRGLEALDAVELVREIFGNPFRPVQVDPHWLAWNENTVAQMARTIYDKRRFGDLPMLADALEEAGCDNADILNHCRAPRGHVRGCWVVDDLLGMK
ncbi:MAG TPA: hypothetical protein VH682_09165 [Gemmataceae bacterium]|jgi:hypothetical protein